MKLSTFISHATALYLDAPSYKLLAQSSSLNLQHFKLMQNSV